MANSHKNVAAADAHAPAAHKTSHEDGGTDEIAVTGLVGLPTRATLGLDTTDSPQLAAVNIGHATDTTLARASAGNLTVEGNALYRAGGTDVAVADGGTGASTATAGFDALSPMTTAGDLILGGASGTRTRLAIGTSTHVLTSNGTTAAWAAAAGGSATVLTSFVKRTAGDITITNDSNWNDIGTISDLSIAAASGDILEFSLDGLTDHNVRVEILLVTSGNYVGSGVGAGSQGIVGWANRSSAAHHIGGSMWYTVVSGDISGGLVAARLRYTTSSSGATKFFAGTSSLGPLLVAVKNLKQ